MLPEGWKRTTFGEATTVASGQVDPTREPFIDMLHIGPEDIESNTGRILEPKTCRELGLISGKYEFDEHAVVYSKIRPHLNKVCFPGFKGLCSADAYPIWPDEKQLNAEYLALYMLGPIFEKRAVACSMRTGMPKINREDLQSIPILIPPLPLQREITEVVNVWDTAIATTEKLLANSRRQKQVLMQQLLTGKRRLQQFVISNARITTRFGSIPADWRHVPIEQIAGEFSAKNAADRQLPVLSCTKYAGLVDSLAYFNKQVFSQDVSTYKLVGRGCFAYATNHIDEGSIGYQNLYDEALISPMYTVFKPGSDIDHGFLFKLLKTEHYRQIFAANTNASVDRRGSLRWGDFKKIEIPLPSMAEQAAISGIIDSAQLEVESIERQLEKLKDEKRALMQQLLTGKRRVRLPIGQVSA